MTAALSVWNRFVERFEVRRTAVPLFDAAPDGTVRLRTIGRGRTQRQVLARSSEMEGLVRTEVARLVDDWRVAPRRLDGLIYMAGLLREQGFVPLYIGKTETEGRLGGRISVNIERLAADTSKFARWGDNYAYHIGDLSACVLPGHSEGKQTAKYRSWAAAMFDEVPCASPRLKEPVFFWCKAWDRTSIGIWEEFGPTRLTFLEYLLIGVGSMCFDQMLNREGLARDRGQGRPA